MTASAVYDWRPKAVIGMASGALIMTVFGCWWVTAGFAAMNVPSLWLVVIGILFGVSLLVPAIGIFRIGRRAARHSVPLTPEQERERYRMGRNFGIIFAAEGLLIFLAVNVLNNLHLGQYILSAIAAIVGVHFLPLARVYRFPAYYFVGGLMTLAAIVSLAIPYPQRESGLAITMGIIIWLTCAFVLRRGFTLAQAIET